MKIKFLLLFVFFKLFFIQEVKNYYSFLNSIRMENFNQPNGQRFVIFIITDKHDEEKIKKLPSFSEDMLGLVVSSNFKAFKIRLEKIHPDVKWVEFNDELKRSQFQNKFNYQESPILLIAHDGLVSFDPKQKF